MQSNYNTSACKVNSLFQQIIPNTIKCTNDKQYWAAKYKPKDAALTHQQIYVNDVNSVRIITVDLDVPSYPYDISPPPNLVTYNKDDGRAHAQYFLQTPVHFNQTSSLKAKRMAIAVSNGLTAHLGGDASYNQTFTKNPLSPIYRNYPIHDRLWDLNHLAEYVTLIDKKPEKTDCLIGWGRNDHVFNEAREWAYRAIRQYKSQTYELFYQATLTHCLGLNIKFPQPLDYPEIKSTAKSIATWVWAERFNLTTFTQRVAERAKSLRVRQATAELGKQQACKLLADGLLMHEIAKQLGVTRMTVYRWLQEVSS